MIFTLMALVDGEAEAQGYSVIHNIIHNVILGSFGGIYENL